MKRQQYGTFALAVGGWFAAEMALAMEKPGEMLLRQDDDYTGDPMARCGATEFDGVLFEGHLDGMLSDLLECCAFDVIDNDKPVTLCVSKRRPSNRDSQWCLQGYAWFEQADPNP